MKKGTKLLIVLLVIIYTIQSSCVNKGPGVDRILEDKDFDLKTPEFSSKETFGISLLNPSDLLLIGDTLIVRDVKTNEYAYHLFKVPKMKYICSQGMIGSGPGETIGSWQVHQYKGSQYASLDMILNKIHIFDKDSINRFAPILTIDLPDTVRYTNDFCFLNDSILVLTGVNSIKRYFKYNIISNSIKSYVDFPNDLLLDNTPPHLHARPCESFLINNHDGTRHALFMRNASRFDVFNSSNEYITSAGCPGYNKPQYIIENGRVAFMKDESINHFVYIQSKDNKIYALYSGKYFRDLNFPFGKTIYVFDWEGQPIEKLNLHDEIFAFEIDLKRGKLYCVNPGVDSVFIYNLNGDI